MYMGVTRYTTLKMEEMSKPCHHLVSDISSVLVAAFGLTMVMYGSAVLLSCDRQSMLPPEVILVLIDDTGNSTNFRPTFNKNVLVVLLLQQQHSVTIGNPNLTFKTSSLFFFFPSCCVLACACLLCMLLLGRASLLFLNQCFGGGVLYVSCKGSCCCLLLFVVVVDPRSSIIQSFIIPSQ